MTGIMEAFWEKKIASLISIEGGKYCRHLKKLIQYFMEAK